MSRHAITVGAGIAPPLGPFSRAVWAGPLLFVSGQTGVDPATGQLVAGGVEQETAQIMRNLSAVLSAAQLDFGDVVKVTVLLIDINDFAAVNRAYAPAFEEPRPARTTAGVLALPGGARVEIELIAMAPSNDAPVP